MGNKQSHSKSSDYDGNRVEEEQANSDSPSKQVLDPAEALEHHVRKECATLLDQGEITGPGWQSLLKDGERLKVWRRQTATGYEYALRGKTERVPADVFFKTAFIDIERRLKWDESCGEAKMLKKCPRTGVETIYWVTKYPWPIAERDYVFHRLCASREKYYFGLSWVDVPPSLRDIDYEKPSEEIAPAKSRVRVQDYTSAMLVKSVPEGSMWAIRVVENPKVTLIPQSVVNWIVSKTLPNSASRLEKACLKSAAGID